MFAYKNLDFLYLFKSILNQIKCTQHECLTVSPPVSYSRIEIVTSYRTKSKTSFCKVLSLSVVNFLYVLNDKLFPTLHILKG